MLLFKEFEILRIAEDLKEKLSQRDFAKETGLSVGTVNTTITKNKEKGLLKDGVITQAGLEALEPYRIPNLYRNTPSVISVTNSEAGPLATKLNSCLSRMER